MADKNVNAQYNFGILHENSEGTEKQIIYWYNKVTGTDVK